MAATDGGINWERIAREHIGRELEREGATFTGAIRKAAYAVRPDGVLSREEIVDLRAQLIVVRNIVEDDVAPVVDGVTPWGGPTYIRDDGYAADYLGLTMAQVNELDNGPVVELTPGELQDVSRGETVCYETAAGQTVRVRRTPTSAAGEVNRGP